MLAPLPVNRVPHIRENVEAAKYGKMDHLAMLAMAITSQVCDEVPNWDGVGASVNEVEAASVRGCGWLASACIHDC